MSGVHWERHARALREAVGAKDELLVCHRLGKHPTESLWKRLEKARASVARFDEELADEQAESREGR